MSPTPTLAEDPLRTPRAAAIAGVIFAVLMIVALGIVRIAASNVDSHSGAWLAITGWRIAFRVAVNLIPFAGVAFLWFLGVLRSQLGRREDKFFATVLLGSGLMFVATLFGAAAAFAGTMESVIAGEGGFAIYDFGLRVSRILLNVFCMKMAAVFMFSTCSIAVRTGFLPRWLAMMGFGCGLILVLVMQSWPWIEMLFPLWILTLSVRELAMEFSGQRVTL